MILKEIKTKKSTGKCIGAFPKIVGNNGKIRHKTIKNFNTLRQDPFIINKPHVFFEMST